jgi:molybdopterin-biosynthesis enzyme MoeA-like protein
MNTGVLIIGDEILTGRRQDKHFSHVVDVLSHRDLELTWSIYVGDDEALLGQYFRGIRAGGDICFSFGGIGATPDDRTRQAMAAAHDVPLVRHPHAVEAIEGRFGPAAYPNRILMADLPQGAGIIPNPFNGIPGFSMGHIHCLPGFPELAWPMLEWVLDNHYPAFKGRKLFQYNLTVQGVYESDLIELMNGLQTGHPGVKLSSLPRYLPDGGREVELGVRGEEEPAAVALAALEAALVDRGLLIDRA